MENQEYLPTNQIAPALGFRHATMIRSLCVNGHYMGMVPEKMPNNRLLFPHVGLTEYLAKQNQAWRFADE